MKPIKISVSRAALAKIKNHGLLVGGPFYPDVGLKATNPKDAFGSAKLPVGLAPDTAVNEMALAFLEGALKYGRYNWRIAGVRASIYNDAMERHRQKWWNGENRDPLSKVKHLANQMACCAIVMDAEICGMLEDDRPPAAPVGAQHDELVKLVAHLKETFKDFNPIQYTEKLHGKSAAPKVGDNAEGIMRAAPSYVGTGIVPPGTNSADVPSWLQNYVDPAMLASLLKPRRKRKKIARARRR